MSFVEGKREMLLAKLRINDKRQKIREFRDQLTYKERLLTIQGEDLRKTTDLVRSNWDSLKTAAEFQMNEIDKLTDAKLIALKRLDELRNIACTKIAENKVLEEKIEEHQNIRDFVRSVFEYCHQPFDEHQFLSYFAKLSREMEQIYMARKNWDKARRKVLRNQIPRFTDFFLTAASIAKRNSVASPMCNKNELPVKFQKMLDLIESEQLDMIEDLQRDELNLLNISDKLNQLDN